MQPGGGFQVCNDCDLPWEPRGYLNLVTWECGDPSQGSHGSVVISL